MLSTESLRHYNFNDNKKISTIDDKKCVKYYLYDKKKNSVRVSKLSELEKGMPIIARLVQEQLFEIAVVSE